MKKSKRIVKYLLFSLSLVLGIFYITSKFSLKTYADENSASPRMNVVFVMDGSGSMKDTDRYKLRYEAIELFMGLSANEGNYMGAVIFSDSLILQKDIEQMNGRDAKNLLASDVRNSGIGGWTDIGMALETATNMLQSQGNSSLDSAIILLTDGNTDLGKDKDTSISEQSKQKAIETARSKGIKVYGICLNADGSASLDEVDEISKATGGTSVEVKSAEDLKDVFSMFYGIIFDTNTIPIPIPEPDENGKLNVEFEIPQIGVEEANIIINTLSTKVKFDLEKPDGVGFTAQELEEMIIKAKTFIVVKVPFPEGGLWKLTISGVTRDEVEINMVYNSNLELQLTNTGESSIRMKELASFATCIISNGEQAGAAATNEKYPIYLEITDSEGKVVNEKMNLDGDGSKLVKDYCFNLPGEYSVASYIDIDGIKRKSNSVSITVNNTYPTTKDFTIKKVKLFNKKPIETDLSQNTSDIEDTDLTYIIIDTDLESNSVSLDGNILIVDAISGGSGFIAMGVSDSAGAESRFTVKVKVINLLLILTIVVSALVLIGLIFVLIKKIAQNNARIKGNLEIMAFTSFGERDTETIEGTKGKMVIGRSTIHVDNLKTGINLNDCIFSAGSRDDVALFTCKNYFYDEFGSKRKTIDLPDQVDVKIYRNMEDKENGLCLVYKKERDSVFSDGFSFGGNGGW